MIVGYLVGWIPVESDLVRSVAILSPMPLRCRRAFYETRALGKGYSVSAIPQACRVFIGVNPNSMSPRRIEGEMSLPSTPLIGQE